MLTLLPILALAAAPPAPLAGCEASAWPDGWRYTCDGLQAQAEDHDGAIPLESVERGVKQRFGEDAERSTQRLRLGGVTTDAVRIASRDGGRTALFATVPRAEGSRLLLCVAMGGDAECRRVLEILASSPWRSGPAGGARVRATQLTLAGKPVEVGEGCQAGAVPRGGMIACGRAFHALWTEEDGAEQARRTMDARVASMVRKLDDGGVPYTRDEVKCAIGGFPARCVRVRAMFPDGRKGIAVAGLLERGGKWTFASCLAEGQTFASKPCSAVFSEP